MQATTTTSTRILILCLVLFTFWSTDKANGYETIWEDEDFGHPDPHTHSVASYGDVVEDTEVNTATTTEDGILFGPKDPDSRTTRARARSRRDTTDTADIVGDGADAEDEDQNNSYDRPDIVPVFRLPRWYSNAHPPRKSGNVAEFNVLIFSVRDINEVDMEISLEVRLQIFWRDHRLANWSLAIEPGKEYIVLHPKALKKIWLPDIYVESLKKVNQPMLISKPASIRVYPDGLIRYSTRVTLTMACKMSFYYYPTDTQTCPVEMKSYAYDDATLRVQWTKKDSLTVLGPDKVELPNLDFNLEVNQTTMVVTRNKNVYSGIKIVVVLTRKLTYHLIQTYIPSALFVVVSWLSFLVPPESVPGRMTICMTTLLTLTSMFASVRANVPKVSYVKAIDLWMVACIFFVFLTLLQYTIVLKLRTRIGREKFNRRMSSHRGTSYAGFGDAPRSPMYPNSGIPLLPLSASPRRRKTDGMITPGPGVIAGGPPSAPGQAQNQSPSRAPLSAGCGSQQVQFAEPDLFEEPPPDPYREAVKTLEKYSWLVMIKLFLIFNFIYWPWLIVMSGYLEPHNQTVYYS